MKSLYSIILIIFIFIFGVSACQKQLTVEDYPALLLKADVTPGEKDKEVAVFLYVTKPMIDYQITTKGEHSKFILLNLNNTLKIMKDKNFNIEGVEELVEQVNLIQITDEKNTKNPLISRLIFKVKDPSVVIKPVFQLQEIGVAKIEKAVKSSQKTSSAIAAAAIANNLGSGSSNNVSEFVIGIIIFWSIVIIGLIIYLLTKKVE